MPCSVLLQPSIVDHNPRFCLSMFVGILQRSALHHCLFQIACMWRRVSCLTTQKGHLKDFALHTLVIAFSSDCSKTHICNGHFFCLGYVEFVGGFAVGGVVFDGYGDQCFPVNVGCQLLDMVARVSFRLGGLGSLCLAQAFVHVITWVQVWDSG